MALIDCPECANKISDKAERCPHCGLPSGYFGLRTPEEIKIARPSNNIIDIDYTKIGNFLISFDRDYCFYFSKEHYISSKEKENLKCKNFFLKVASNFSIVLQLHFPQCCKFYFPTL